MRMSYRNLTDIRSKQVYQYRYSTYGNKCIYTFEGQTAVYHGNMVIKNLIDKSYDYYTTTIIIITTINNLYNCIIVTY